MLEPYAGKRETRTSGSEGTGKIARCSPRPPDTEMQHSPGGAGVDYRNSAYRSVLAERERLVWTFFAGFLQPSFTLIGHPLFKMTSCRGRIDLQAEHCRYSHAGHPASARAGDHSVVSFDPTDRAAGRLRPPLCFCSAAHQSAR